MRSPRLPQWRRAICDRWTPSPGHRDVTLSTVARGEPDYAADRGLFRTLHQKRCPARPADADAFVAGLPRWLFRSFGAMAPVGGSVCPRIHLPQKPLIIRQRLDHRMLELAAAIDGTTL